MDDKKHGRDESEDLPLNKAATPDHKVQDYSFQERCKKDGKEVFVINDPIHGHIELHSLLIKIIDTPQFQRLRYIKQLGGGYYVFPGASHNRFEHSIGVSHLAGEFAESLRERQPKLNITDQDVLCVKIAGLCHDLGHGPFSHLFDGMFIPEVLRKEGDSALGKDKWKHEKGSILMLEHLIDSNNLKEEFKKNGLDEGDLMFIKELIDGPQQETDDESEWPYMGRDADKGFLYEIVANKRTGIDVDKFDYFARDSHGLGILINFDHKRYIKFARAIKVGNKWQICSRDKEVTNLYDLFYIRNRLHRTAYKHKTTQIVEIMITEALVKADKHVFIPGKDSEEVRMSQAICDPHAYTNLNDSIIFSIMQSTKEELAESKKILEQLQRRQLYKCVVQAQFDSEEKEEKIKEGILKLREQNTSCSEDLADCLIVKVVKFHYGMGSKNPIDEMRFYSKENPDEAKPIHKHLVSQMLPETFQEKLIFIFCKSMEMSTLEAVYSCFEAWCKEKQKYLTPSKKNSALYDPIKVFSTTKKVTQDEEEDADGSRKGESVKRSLFKS